MRINPEDPQQKILREEAGKISYTRPTVIALGDLRCVVLGGTPGAGESGGSGVRKRNTPTGRSIGDTGDTDPYAPSDPGQP
jgi:hypothetical protein